MRVNLHKDKGRSKALEFMDILRYRIKKNKNLKAEIYHILSKYSFKDQRIKALKIAIALMFQKKSYSNYAKYNPFDQVSINKSLVKLYIANLF